MEKIRDIIERSIQVKTLVLQDENLLQIVHDVITAIVASFNTGRRLYFCGNGGSAADAQHLAAEFSGRFYKDRKALPAEALHVQHFLHNSGGQRLWF
jgi:D-sedoheptulose 7-phosphate isomerase